MDDLGGEGKVGCVELLRASQQLKMKKSPLPLFLFFLSFFLSDPCGCRRHRWCCCTRRRRRRRAATGRCQWLRKKRRRRRARLRLATVATAGCCCPSGGRRVDRREGGGTEQRGKRGGNTLKSLPRSSTHPYVCLYVRRFVCPPGTSHDGRTNGRRRTASAASGSKDSPLLFRRRTDGRVGWRRSSSAVFVVVVIDL
jgi:hypothetical protein